MAKDSAANTATTSLSSDDLQCVARAMESKEINGTDELLSIRADIGNVILNGDGDALLVRPVVQGWCDRWIKDLRRCSADGANVALATSDVLVHNLILSCQLHGELVEHVSGKFKGAILHRKQSNDPDTADRHFWLSMCKFFAAVLFIPTASIGEEGEKEPRQAISLTESSLKNIAWSLQALPDSSDDEELKSTMGQVMDLLVLFMGKSKFELLNRSILQEQRTKGGVASLAMPVAGQLDDPKAYAKRRIERQRQRERELSGTMGKKRRM
jgi:hypothetical protein